MLTSVKLIVAILLRLALRLGFQEAAPDEFDAVREAVGKQATKDL